MTGQTASDVTYEEVDLRVSGVGLKVATAGRDGGLAPVVFLHGFGSTKEATSTSHASERSPDARSSPTTHQDAARPVARTCRASRSRSWSRPRRLS